MLTQLTRLSIEADGRYAVADELQFLKSYFHSLEERTSAYEKIRTSEVEIIRETEAKMRLIDANIFLNAAGDFTERWRNDIVQLLRYAAAALLFNEHEHLREGLLLWHNTIAKSYQFDHTCKVTFEVMPDVVKHFLTPEEAALFCPILSLNHILLG